MIEIKTLISHPMESGYRVGPNGAMIPRDIIRLFICTYNGEEMFPRRIVAGDRGQPVHRRSSRPPTESGTLAFRWTGDNGFDATQTAEIAVE